MGVRRAVDLVLDAANNSCDTICTYGPLIHNPQVLTMLEKKGIPAITHIPDNAKGTVLIRAHGVPPEVQENLKCAGFKVINATCPRVIRVQTIIRKHAEKGFTAIIVGDLDHPEVKGLIGYSRGKGHTVSTMEELHTLPRFDQAVIVAQTTQDTSFYNEIKTWAAREYPHYKIFDTICDSTEKRQAEVRRIAQQHNAVVVVGGKESGNTQRLAQIAAETGKYETDKYETGKYETDKYETGKYETGKYETGKYEAGQDKIGSRYTIHIEDVSELDIDQMKALASADSIAITAGASTPNWIINQTFRVLEEHLQKECATSSLLFIGRQIRDFLLRSNLLLSAGAGSLTYACAKLQSIEHVFVHSCVAMLYVLSMQIMNNLFSISSDRYNNPGRADFYKRHKKVLALAAVLSGSAGLYLSFSTALLPFILISIMSLLGLLYNTKLFAATFRNRNISRIKDIPGSKTVLISVAWGTVTSLLPALSAPGVTSLLPAFSIPGVISLFSAFLVPDFSSIRLTCIFPFILTTALLFARTAFFAILEIQGDRIIGKDTLPIILGEKKSLALIRNILYTAATILFISAMFGLISKIGIIIAVVPLSMFYVIKSHETGNIYPGMHLEFVMESHLLIPGIMAFFLKQL